MTESIESDPSIFEPVLYDFEVSPQLLESMVIMNFKDMEVDAPDFGDLLDHAMATLWYIFADDGDKLMDLKKADIAWTLKFLESLDTSTLLDSDQDIKSLILYLSAILSSRYALEDENEYENHLESVLNSMEFSLNTSQISEDYKEALLEKHESGELEWEMPDEPMQQTENILDSSTHNENIIEMQLTDENGKTRSLNITDLPWQDVCRMLEKEGKNSRFEDVFRALERQKLLSKPGLISSTPFDKNSNEAHDEKFSIFKEDIFYDVSSGEEIEQKNDNEYPEINKTFIK